MYGFTYLLQLSDVPLLLQPVESESQKANMLAFNIGGRGTFMSSEKNHFQSEGETQFHCVLFLADCILAPKEC